MIELNKKYFRSRQGAVDIAIPVAIIDNMVYFDLLYYKEECRHTVYWDIHSFNKVWIIQTDLTMALV